MPRTKKRKTPAQSSAQYSRSLKNKDGKYRGKLDYKTYKRKSKKSKKVLDKIVTKTTYQSKYEKAPQEIKAQGYKN